MPDELLISAEQRIKELVDELERMRPVVEAARKWRHDETFNTVAIEELLATVITYESAITEESES